MSSLRIIAVSVAASLLLTGCSQGQSNDEEPQPSTSASVSTAEEVADGQVDAKELAKKMENAWNDLKFYKSTIEFADGEYQEFEVDRRNPKSPALHLIVYSPSGETEEIIEIPGDGTYVKLEDEGHWFYTAGGPYTGGFDYSASFFEDLANDGVVLDGPQERNGIQTTHYRWPDDGDVWIDDKFNLVEVNFGPDRMTHKLWDHNVPVEIKAPKKS